MRIEQTTPFFRTRPRVRVVGNGRIWECSCPLSPISQRISVKLCRPVLLNAIQLPVIFLDQKSSCRPCFDGVSVQKYTFSIFSIFGLNKVPWQCFNHTDVLKMFHWEGLTSLYSFLSFLQAFPVISGPHPVMSVSQFFSSNQGMPLHRKWPPYHTFRSN
jgi:hypothetical protein